MTFGNELEVNLSHEWMIHWIKNQFAKWTKSESWWLLNDPQIQTQTNWIREERLFIMTEKIHWFKKRFTEIDKWISVMIMTHNQTIHWFKHISECVEV